MKKMTMQSTALALFAGATLCAANLSADTLGFWDFKDGAPGEEVLEVKNSVGATVFTGTAAKSSENGSLPTFASDSPGRIIVSSRDAMELSAAPQSVAFRYPSRSNRQSGLIDIGGIADELVGKGSFTIELFVKMDENYQYWMKGDGYYDQISKTVLYLEALKNVGGFKMIAPRNVINSGDTMGHASGFAFEVYGRTNDIATVDAAGYNSTRDISDGKWHHLAVVYQETDSAAQTGTLSFYVDYGIIGKPTPYANTKSADTGLKFRLGTGYKDAQGKVKTSTEPINASLSCLRVSSAALAVDEFEVVNENGKAVFAIGFNKESVVDGTPIGTSAGLSTSVDLSIYSEVGLNPKPRFDYGLHSEAFPQYDMKECRTNRRVRWGDKKMWTNLAGCHFLGYTSLASGTALRQYAGTALCVAGSSDVHQNPPSWTMEAFVRVEYDQTWGGDVNGSLLFGKSATNAFVTSGQQYPQYCWMLTRTRANKLRLSWTEVEENGIYTKDSEKMVETDTDYLGDKAWHHVALSYDQPSHAFTLYVDYQAVLMQTVGEMGLLNNLWGSYYFSRLACSAGFEGWMDEIRFTNGALKPEAFETLDKAGLTITIR